MLFFRSSRVAWCLIYGVVLSGIAVEAQPADPATAGTFPQPLLEMYVPVPPTPVAVMDSSRLVYELHLTNVAQESLVVEQVDVLDVEDGIVIAALGREDVERRLQQPEESSATGGPRTIASDGRGVVYIELMLADGVLPRALAHHVIVHSAGEDVRHVVQGSRIPVHTEPPVVLSPPLRGGPWIAVYNPFWERGHRRVLYTVDGRERIPGRYAIDWMKVDADGRLARGDADTVRTWHGYGADVLAVADGIVVATRDDVAESATVSGHTQPPAEDATGNYVALDLGDGRYVFYEHLQPGSIRVVPGDRVRRGDVLGAVGFTGQTAGPHLHLHVADTNAPLGAEGVPFVLDAFTLLGAYPDFEQVGNAPWLPLEGPSEARRTGERPAPNVVVAFAASASPE